MGATGEHDSDLVDLAAGGLWRHVDEAGNPPNGAHAQIDPNAMPGAAANRFGSQIDLGLRFPVHSVRIDLAGGMSPAASPGLAFSDDGRTWMDAPLAPEKGAGTPDRMVIAQDEGRWARHVRITMRGPAGPAVRGGQVWCERSAFDLITLRRVLGAEVDMLHERPGIDAYRAYSLVGAEHTRGRSLVGIAVFENGAFGNCLIQYLLAIGIARHLGLRYVKLPAIDRSEVIALTGPLNCGDITFIPAADPFPPDGYFLSGMYFDLSVQKLAGELGQKETREIVRTYIRPLFNRLPSRIPPKPDDELLIHIRSGDIFSTWVAPHYPQPPLAFYRLVIDRLRAEGLIRSVKLVFENRLNPVIPALEAHLAEIGMPFTTQSGSLVDDVAALLNGRYLVFGLGTFGSGVCQLSERVEQVFYFASGWPQHFRGITTIDKIVEVVDLAGAYTKVGEWDNSPRQRALMIEYPIENLAFDDA